MVLIGKKDIITKNYMENPEVFADAFNLFLYKGEQVITAGRLRPMNTAAVGIPYGEKGTELPVQRFRDSLKCLAAKEDGKAVYLLLGIEFQSGVSYAMPVKNMLYDALQYAEQVKQTARSYRRAASSEGKKTGWTAGEYLSGFRKEDRLVPVVTLVIYFGPGKWDGPMSLHEMLSIKDPGILAYVPDYRLSLLAPGMMKDEEIRKLETSLREVLLYIKYSEDKEKLRKLIEEDERFHALEKEAILVISTVTETRFKVKKKEEKADMCKGMRDLIEDGRQEGLAQGIRMVVGNILKTGRYTLEELVEISGLTLEELKQMEAAQG